MSTNTLFKKKSTPGQPDYNLLTTRLKQMALKGVEQEKCLSTLKKAGLYPHLSAGQLRDWSDIALVLGESGLALDILTWCNENHPHDFAAWKKSFELLQSTGQMQKAQSIRARAVMLHPGLEDRLVLPAPQLSAEHDTEVDDPFISLRRHEELLRLYVKYFQGREDVFARQWVDKNKGSQGYIPVRRPMTRQDVLDHLKGHKTYGIYLLRSDSTAMTAVIDMDLNKSLRSGRITRQDKTNVKREKDYVLTRLKEMSVRDTGCAPLCEFSGGKGYHFWFFFDKPVAAALARKILTPMVTALNRDCRHFRMEIFPKQDQLQGKGLGNLIKLPLGIHRVSGKPSYFLEGHGMDCWANINLLQEQPRIMTSSLDMKSLSTQKQTCTLHPGYARWAEKFPELHILSENCPALGKIIIALRSSRELGMREEKVLFQTIGFLSRARHLMHSLLGNLPEYNPHLVDYRLSRLRGSPLGCKKIHQLLAVNQDFCTFDQDASYAHPLLHCPDHVPKDQVKAEKIENLNEALDHLKTSLDMVQRFLKSGNN